jgi:AcrR family transcriptional regulator
MKEKSFDRREELLKAALDEFGMNSYEKASLNRIIKNAGISKGTFYYHFQDKEALYLALIRDLANAKIEFVGSRMRGYGGGEELDLFENLKLQARSGIDFAREYPGYFLFGMMFYKEKGHRIYETTMNMLGNTSEKYFEELVEKAMIRDDIKPGITEQFATKIITYLLTRYDELFETKDAAEFDFDRTLRDIDGLIDFIRYGIGSGRTAADPCGEWPGLERMAGIGENGRVDSDNGKEGGA